MNRISSKRGLLKYINSKLLAARELETIKILKEIRHLYLFQIKEEDEILNEENLKLKLKDIYFNFCRTVLQCEPQYDISDKKAMIKMVEFLKNTIRNKHPKLSDQELNTKVIEAFGIILNPDNWNKFPNTIKNYPRLRQIVSNRLNIIKFTQNNINSLDIINNRKIYNENKEFVEFVMKFKNE